jgi:hypothetical protein
MEVALAQIIRNPLHLSANRVTNLGSILCDRSLLPISQVIAHAPERMCNSFESRCGGLPLLVDA